MSALSRLEELLLQDLPPGRAARRSRADEVSGCLRALGRRPSTPGVEKLVASGGDKRLQALVDSSGSTCRAVAVEVLLGLGYPDALQVSPEDLRYFRKQQHRRWWWRLRAVGAGLIRLFFVLPEER